MILDDLLGGDLGAWFSIISFSLVGLSTKVPNGFALLAAGENQLD
jgi:hypothetical protein